jgi:hypothetical protein
MRESHPAIRKEDSQGGVGLVSGYRFGQKLPQNVWIGEERVDIELPYFFATQ